MCARSHQELDIGVHDAFRVKVLESPCDLSHDVEDGRQIESLLQRCDGEIAAAARHRDDVRVKWRH